ncbi:MAG: hypothetical protein ACRDAX_03945 [Propionibacteriaceae bacterium]
MSAVSVMAWRTAILMIAVAGIVVLGWAEGYLWIAFALVIAAIGWLYQVRLAEKNRPVSVTHQRILTVLVITFTGLGVVGAFFGDDNTLRWLSLPGFAVAWGEYMWWWGTLRDEN